MITWSSVFDFVGLSLEACWLLMGVANSRLAHACSNAVQTWEDKKRDDSKPTCDPATGSLHNKQPRLVWCELIYHTSTAAEEQQDRPLGKTAAEAVMLTRILPGSSGQTPQEALSPCCVEQSRSAAGQCPFVSFLPAQHW